jgi:hypothetical protein
VWVGRDRGSKLGAVHAPPRPREKQRGSVRPGRRLTNRLSAGHWLVLIAGLLAGLLNFALLRGDDGHVTVAVAAETIAPGQAISSADLTTARVEADDGLLARLVPGTEIDSIVGSIAATRVASGDPVPRSALHAPGATDLLRTMSLPIDPSHAVGGELRPGDRVDIIAVDEGRGRYIAEDIEVVGVADREGGGALGAHLGSYHLVLAVDAATALELATAVRGEGVEVVRATGSGSLRSEGLEVGRGTTDGPTPDDDTGTGPLGGDGG